MGSRTWIKIYCDKWLNGTIREESLEVRAVWVDLLVLAGSGNYGDSGEIKITNQVGFLDQQLADLMQISVQKWVACKKKLVETDRVWLKNGNIIVIKNWSKYQSEYERQRAYRQLDAANNQDSGSCNQKLQDKVTTESYNPPTELASNSPVPPSPIPLSPLTPLEIRDYRLEIENRDRDTPLNPPVSSSLSIKEVTELYQENILLGATAPEDMESELNIACGRYSPAWVRDAIKESCLQNHPAWPYIVGILKHWQRYGKGAKFPGKA